MSLPARGGDVFRHVDPAATEAADYLIATGRFSVPWSLVSRPVTALIAAEFNVSQTTILPATSFSPAVTNHLSRGRREQGSRPLRLRLR